MELQGWRSQILDSRLLKIRCPDSKSGLWRLLGSMLATRRYKVRPYAVNTHGVTGWRSPELNGRLLHNRCTDSVSDSWRLLGLTSATRRYKVRPCHIKSHEITGLCGGGLSSPGGILLDGRFLHNRWVYSSSVSWRLLGSMSATQRYKIRPYHMKTHEVMVSYGGTVQVVLSWSSRSWLYFLCKFDFSYSSIWAIAIIEFLCFSYSSIWIIATIIFRL